MYSPNYRKIIENICKNIGVEFKILDVENEIFQLKYNGKCQYIFSRRFPLNSEVASRLMDNKYQCSLVLSENNIATLKYYKLCRMDSDNLIMGKSNFEIVYEIFTKHNKVVIKPNNSFEGNSVFLCHSSRDIEKNLYRAFQKHKYLVASPYINIKNEYRVVFLDGVCKLIYKKIIAFVEGDGKSSVISLLKMNNLSKFIASFEDPFYVPSEGEKLYTEWKHNLSLGATPELIYSDTTKERLCILAKDAGAAIGCRFASIDIVEDVDNNFMVLEINSGVAMDQFIDKFENGSEISYQIYKSAIEKIFE